MNRPHFKDPVSHICLPGAVVASWSLKQEVAGSSPFTIMSNVFVAEFSETFRKNSIMAVYLQINNSSDWTIT